MLKLAKRYQRYPVLRGLIQLIPFGIGSGIDAALLTRLQNISEERTKAFFDELAEGNIVLKPELLESEDFLHCFFATAKAALNTRRREKIKFFAKLLKASTLPDAFSNTDEYEEYLWILDELSFRELSILFILDNYESQFPKIAEENDLQRANRFWDRFTTELIEKLSVPKDEIDAILTRLNRTGCYETFVGGYFDYTGGKGKLTSTYFRLKKLIQMESGNST
jgi:hypothetical protein